MAALVLLLGLSLAQAQSPTITTTITQTQTFTVFPTITINQGGCGSTSSSTSLELCANLLATWDPFGFSANSTSTSSSRSTTSQSFTTTTTTTTRSSSTSGNIPAPSNLYIFAASDTETLDIDTSGNIILSDPSTGLTAAFILNADGTLTSYGSNVNVFADFSNKVAKRAIDTAYGLGYCLSQSVFHRRSRLGGRIVIFPRTVGVDGKSYGTFSINGGSLQFSTDGATYGWANCVSNAVAIYDTASDDVPGSCGAIDLAASSVPRVSYSQYYSVGLKKRSRMGGVATCSTSPPLSTSISTMSSQTGNATTGTNYGGPKNPTSVPTSAAPEAGFTSSSDPYPVFAMAALAAGGIYVNDDLQLVMHTGNETDFHGFQLTPDDRMVFYGGNFTVYANTSVRDVDIIDRRAVCYGNSIVLKLSTDGTFPAGATIGPFITDPRIGLILLDWVFLSCDDDAHLELSYLDCPIRDSCTVVNPALYLLDSLSKQQALYNGGLIAQRANPTTSISTPPTTTVELVETNAVDAVRNILIAGGYYDFCSSELGLYLTSTVTQTETTTVSTETTASTTTVELTNYSTTIVEEITTATTFKITTTTTSTSSSYKIQISRSVTWTTETIPTLILTPTIFYTELVYDNTKTITVPTLVVTTVTPNGRRKRDLHDISLASEPNVNRSLTNIFRRTQIPDLTPTYIKPYDPSIVESACSLYFQFRYDNLGISTTSLTVLNGRTTLVNGTRTSYTSTSTFVSSTSLDVLGTITSYIFTTTTTSISTTSSTKTELLETTTTSTTTATDLKTFEIQAPAISVISERALGTKTQTIIGVATTTICRPVHSPFGTVIGGQLLPSPLGARAPFRNYTQGRDIKGTITENRGQIGWMNIPSLFPGAPLVARCQADMYRDPPGWAWLGQYFYTCPGTVYTVSVTYKWLYDINNPYPISPQLNSYELRNTYRKSVFSLWISAREDYEKNTIVSALDSPLKPGVSPQNRKTNYGANVLTQSFRAVNGSVLVYFGFTWQNDLRRNGEVIVPLSERQYNTSYNELWVYNFNISDTVGAPLQNSAWFLPDNA